MSRLRCSDPRSPVTTMSSEPAAGRSPCAGGEAPCGAVGDVASSCGVDASRAPSVLAGAATAGWTMLPDWVGDAMVTVPVWPFGVVVICAAAGSAIASANMLVAPVRSHFRCIDGRPSRYAFAVKSFIIPSSRDYSRLDLAPAHRWRRHTPALVLPFTGVTISSSNVAMLALPKTAGKLFVGALKHGLPMLVRRGDPAMVRVNDGPGYGTRTRSCRAGSCHGAAMERWQWRSGTS